MRQRFQNVRSGIKLLESMSRKKGSIIDNDKLCEINVELKQGDNKDRKGTFEKYI